MAPRLTGSGPEKNPGMTRRLAALAVLLVLVVLGAAAPAAAQQARTTPADVAAALRSDPVYVDRQVPAGIINAAAVRAEIGRASRPVFVAVLPEAAGRAYGGPGGVTSAIGQALGRADAVLFTVVGGTLAGGAGARSGLEQGQAGRIARANAGGDLTQALVRSVRAAGTAASDGAVSDGFGSSSSGSGGSGGGFGGGGAVLGVLGLLAAGAGGLFYLRSRKRTSKSLEGSRADVESLYSRLGADVASLAPGDDPVARQALADAAERYNATGALLSQADTPSEFVAARRTAVEGLTAARVARQRLGLDPGPEIPPPPGEGPQLQAEQRVRVGDEEFDGSPTYTPGRRHYYGGGYVGGHRVPGGWYGVPFWETALLGGALSGLSGGLVGGMIGGGLAGGYGGNTYERGYEEGVEDAQEVFDDRSGGIGGGDWGGGDVGGDWGGGDFGGGGGDWGGGGDFGGGDGNQGGW